MIVIQDNEFRRGALRPTRGARRTASSSGSISPTSPARSTASSVYLSRSRAGQGAGPCRNGCLDRVPLDDDTIVVPVPDTGKAAADAMAFELGLPSVEGLMRNRYIGRTFIEGQNRADRVRMKYTPLREVLEGKRVLLIEDTIVRSTTLKSLLHHDARAGRGPRGPRPRRLPADRGAVFLRHRHVHRARVVRAALHAGQGHHGRGAAGDGRASWGRIAFSICRWKRLRAASACRRIGFAARALPASIRRRPASAFISWRCAIATAPTGMAVPTRWTDDGLESRL